MSFNSPHHELHHEHYHGDCHHNHDHNYMDHEKILPVHLNYYENIKTNPFFAEYVVYENKKEVKDLNNKKLVISSEEGSTIDIATLDYIVLMPGAPDKVLISACKTALQADSKTAVVSGFIEGEDTIELRCSKKSLTDDDIGIESGYHENQPITVLSIQGGSGLAAISFLGEYPELMQSINIDNSVHHH